MCCSRLGAAGPPGSRQGCHGGLSRVRGWASLSSPLFLSLLVHRCHPVLSIQDHQSVLQQRKGRALARQSGQGPRVPNFCSAALEADCEPGPSQHPSCRASVKSLLGSPAAGPGSSFLGCAKYISRPSTQLFNFWVFAIFSSFLCPLYLCIHTKRSFFVILMELWEKGKYWQTLPPRSSVLCTSIKCFACCHGKMNHHINVIYEV